LGVADLVGAAAVGVGAVGAEGGYFSQGGYAIELSGNQHYAEVSANGEGAWEEIKNDAGSGRGGDIVVLGLAAEQQIAHAAACEIGLMAFFLESAQDSVCGGELRARVRHNFFLSLSPKWSLLDF
jgi:hypothetical protein